jgi:hypothetical protein
VARRRRRTDLTGGSWRVKSWHCARVGSEEECTDTMRRERRDHVPRRKLASNWGYAHVKSRGEQAKTAHLDHSSLCDAVKCVQTPLQLANGINRADERDRLRSALPPSPGTCWVNRWPDGAHAIDRD